MHKKKLKILFLAGWFPNKLQPYAGIFIKRHAQAISKYCDVIVFHILADPNLEKSNYEFEELKQNGIIVINLYYKISDLNNLSLSKIRKIFRFINGCRKGLSLINKKYSDFDIVHLNVIHPIGILALYLKFLKRKPFIVTEHWTGYTTTRNLYGGFKRKIFTYFVIKTASGITTVSESLANEMKQRGLANQYHVIPNAIEFKRKKIHLVSLEKKIILHISSLLNDQKNVEGIIKALKNISIQRKDFELRIVGGENDKKYLETLVKDLGLEKLIQFYGQVSDDEIEKHYNESDFFVLNSNYETFSVVAAESLACGVPVIVTKSGGPEEFVTSDQGIVIEPQNQDELEDAILNMLDNYKKYDSDKLSEYAKSKFSFDVIGKLFLQIYENIK